MGMFIIIIVVNSDNNSDVNDYNDDDVVGEYKKNRCRNCDCGDNIMKHNLPEHTGKWKYDQIRTAEIKHDITFITLHLGRQYLWKKITICFHTCFLLFS